MINKNRIKYLRQLHQKKCRDAEKKYIAEGNKICEEAVTCHPELVEEIICTKSWASGKKNLPIEKLTITNYDTICRISGLTTPQETLVVLKTVYNDASELISPNDIILVLDSVKDPGNLGTIIRLADWFGVENIVCSNDSVDCYNPKVVQATMGAILRTKLYYTKLSEFLSVYKSSGIAVFGTTLEGTDIYRTQLLTPSILIMGNESAGISEEVRNFLTRELYIPNFSSKAQKSESLNVSMATAIVLSEFRRLGTIRNGMK